MKIAASRAKKSISRVILPKIRVLAQIFGPLNFFPKCKLKITHSVWKFPYILPYVAKEKYHNFSVDIDILLLYKLNVSIKVQ